MALEEVVVHLESVHLESVLIQRPMRGLAGAFSLAWSACFPGNLVVRLRRSREFTRVCSPKFTYHLVSGVVVSTVFGGTGGPVWPELARAK